MRDSVEEKAANYELDDIMVKFIADMDNWLHKFFEKESEDTKVSMVRLEIGNLTLSYNAEKIRDLVNEYLKNQKFLSEIGKTDDKTIKKHLKDINSN